MADRREIEVPILNPIGQALGTLKVSLLPRVDEEESPKPLLDLRDDPDRDPTLEPVQLLEATEYLYKLSVNHQYEGAITTDRPEIFQADTLSGEQGRLRPGLYTGTIPVTIFVGERELGRVALEVRSRKVDYLSHYRWMLRDIAEGFAEVVMERFSPSELRFEVDDTRDAPTLYQRFAFLKSLIIGEAFEAAIQQILARPHRTWMVEDELRAPGQTQPAASTVARQIASPGPRVPWPATGLSGNLASLPARLSVQRYEETLDTPENRFIKFALTRWRDAVAHIGLTLATQPPSHPVTRGLREVEVLTEQLDALLSVELFREVGILTQFPTGSQVLQKRAGYRDIFRAYVHFEAAAVIAWKGGEDVYAAGQRDVATLYEYWAFLQLAGVVSRVSQAPFSQADLLGVGEDGLGISLRRGREQVLSATVTRLGRRLRLELYFNRTFGRGHAGASTWTRPMRPDCSLRIAPDEKGSEFEEVWLHFDAKYRVENLAELFNDKPVTSNEGIETLAGNLSHIASIAKRDDLLKMHVYRDAIRRSAGAYVIYPGDEKASYRLYHEILPGLGAFAVRPTETGDAQGTTLLYDFIADVLDHVASQATQYERSRFWHREAYQNCFQVDRPVPAVPFLERPPADTFVLLGYVKSKEHMEWIHRNLRYNLRADGRTGTVGLRSRELGTDLVLLYGPMFTQPEIWRVDGEPEVWTRARMQFSGYPDPRGELYYCVRLAGIPRDQWPPTFSLERIQAVKQRVKPGAVVGMPVVTTWLELIR